MTSIRSQFVFISWRFNLCRLTETRFIWFGCLCSFKLIFENKQKKAIQMTGFATDVIFNKQCIYNIFLISCWKDLVQIYVIFFWISWNINANTTVRETNSENLPALWIQKHSEADDKDEPIKAFIEQRKGKKLRKPATLQYVNTSIHTKIQPFIHKNTKARKTNVL